MSRASSIRLPARKLIIFLRIWSFKLIFYGIAEIGCWRHNNLLVFSDFFTVNVVPPPLSPSLHIVDSTLTIIICLGLSNAACCVINALAHAICIMPVNVKFMNLNYVRMGDQQVLLRMVQPKITPLFPTQGNQVRDQPRVFPTKVMIRQL